MSKSKVYGVDPGTMFFQTAEMKDNNKIEYTCTRNAFVELKETDDIEDLLKQNNWKYIKDGENYYVIGEDALRVAKMLPGKVELRRPLQDGVLNKGEEKKMVVLAELIKSSIGEAPDDKSVVCTCVSSPSADGSVDSSFHKSRLTSMFERNGYKTKVIEEAFAIILSENPKAIDSEGKEASYSGIAFSFGSGRTNCVLAYKGIQIVGFSIAFGGDKIDKLVSDQTDTPISQVIAKKEKALDFTNIDYDDDIVYALDVYYTEMIKNVLNIFSKKFNEIKGEFDSLDVVIAGGTSMPKGFCNKFEEIIRGMKFPFTIKEVKHAENPRNAVVKGCLRQAFIIKKKLDSNSGDLNSIL